MEAPTCDQEEECGTPNWYEERRRHCTQRRQTYSKWKHMNPSTSTSHNKHCQQKGAGPYKYFQVVKAFRLSVDTVSSEAAVEDFTKPRFQKDIQANVKSSQSLDKLTARAKKIVEDFSTNEHNTLKYKKSTIGINKIMNALLAHAEDAGGEGGKRYVASAIVACLHDGGINPEKITALAVTWLTHLLFIFKAGHSHSPRVHSDPSPIATPTIDKTMAVLDQGVGNRKSAFRDELLLRDGHECVVTGQLDYSNPAPRSPGRLRSNLKACHILRRAIMAYDDKNSNSKTSAAATLDILVNFTRLSHQKLLELTDLIDDPSNGFLLESIIHEDFDNFKWCLQKTNNANEYKIKFYDQYVADRVRSQRGMFVPPDKLDGPVAFVDRSAKARADLRKRARSLALPDPDFIRIHAAIAGIMHSSGAGRFFDELLDKYRDPKGPTPLLRWADLERAAEEQEVRESLHSAFTQIRVS